MNLGQIIDPARVWGEGKTHDGEARREKQAIPMARRAPSGAALAARTVVRMDEEAIKEQKLRARRLTIAAARHERTGSSISGQIRGVLRGRKSATLQELFRALPHFSRDQVNNAVGQLVFRGYVHREGVRSRSRYRLDRGLCPE